ncbi:MAG: 2-oxoglutarate dehydrogenase complex dihydrolipoyllysine-residue succinyltransferase [Phycisphaeraceae bacterium]|nr:2-oxoglutarate dehydrogenase complex dihydrolipoyllysine-residue succinyltransferase [Phycisphaeraceae bacterium]
MSTDILIPTVGESVASGVLSKWLKPDGAFVKRDEAVLELETDKVNMEIVAPADGILRHAAKEGDTVNVGAVVGRMEAGGSPAAPATSVASESGSATSVLAPPAADTAKTSDQAANGEIRATPLAKKVAAEHGVDLSKVSGTGAGHRVREQDVIDFVKGKSPAPAAASPPSKAPAPAPSGPRATTVERMSPIRQRIAQRLVEAQHTAAMLTTFNEVDMTRIMALRAKYKESFEKKHGIGLGFMSFFVKAAANALMEFPTVNAYMVKDAEGYPAVQKHAYADIAIAVSTPKGLVVPVLRNAERMSFAQVESGIKELATKARDGKLTLEEMQGGTFTITNGGVFGSLMSTPILNPPQSAILGMHATKNRAVEDPDKPGQVAIRPMMYLALSYDHRMVDGEGAVRFLVRIKDQLENPERILLEV